MHAIAATMARAVSCRTAPAIAITNVGIHNSGVSAIRYGNGKWPSQPAGISLKRNPQHTYQQCNPQRNTHANPLEMAIIRRTKTANEHIQRSQPVLIRAIQP